ncbi:molybdenum cofactor biosynthesis protein MoaE [Glycocaulis sp.]|jgi:molybdopterin synthase catalytic subunit
MQCIARLTGDRLIPECETGPLMEAAAGAGGLVLFTGIARPVGKDGARVDRLELDIHPRLTEKSLNDIAGAALCRFDISLAVAIHRWGEVPAGEAVVLAGAAALHRREAFLAADFIMDHLKTEAVFWKREIGPSGARWVEPSERDLADLARWKD